MAVSGKRGMTVLSVSQLNRYAKSLLEQDSRLKEVYLRGELCDVRVHYRSGHMYFTLSDSDASVKGIMFQSHLAGVTFEPADGMKVLVRAGVGLYEKDGGFRITAYEILPDGAGESGVRLEMLKQKLAAEGLFETARKRPIPQHPANVAVITSLSGAALKDVINIISRRCPTVGLKVIPADVQGAGAVRSIVTALDYLGRTRAADTVIICRGGGSGEDLAAFNDEALVRAVAASAVPTISAVGHETDVTLTDFAADMRAPTPSAAAELAVSDMSVSVKILSDLKNRLARSAKNRYAAAERSFDMLKKIFFSYNPYILQAENRQKFENLVELLRENGRNNLEKKRGALANQMIGLTARDPVKILAGGYTVTMSGDRVLTSAGAVLPNGELKTIFGDGEVYSAVTRTVLKQSGSGELSGRSIPEEI